MSIWWAVYVAGVLLLGAAFWALASRARPERRRALAFLYMSVMCVVAVAAALVPLL